MSLWQRLKIPGPPLDFDYKKDIASFEASRLRTPDEVAIKNIGPGGLAENYASRYFFIALEAYVAEAFEVCKEYVLKAIPKCEEYFFGKWRDEVPSGNYRDKPPDRIYQDRICLWSSLWQDCLLWCSVIGEWDALLRFAEYPRDDVNLDPEQSAENRAWLLLVAGKLRGRPVRELQPFSETILGGKRKREKLLFWLFEAILEEDPDEASKCLKEYATYYRTAEFPKEDLTTKVAFDASFLVHYAEYTDVPILVPDKLKDHIVRLP